MPILRCQDSVTLDRVFASDIFVAGNNVTLPEVVTGDLSPNICITDLTIQGGHYDDINLSALTGVLVSGVTCRSLRAINGTNLKIDINIPSADAGVSAIDLDSCSRVKLSGLVISADEHGIRIDDCQYVESDVWVIGASLDTDNAFDGISLEGATSDCTIRGGVKHANQTNRPAYGLQIGAGCNSIDVWCSLINSGDLGAIDDQGTGTVIH